MRQVVRDNFSAFSTKFEGAVPWMYLDIKGLVTTGIGNLINSPGAATALPWRHGVDGPYATANEIAQAWQTVHDMAGKRDAKGRLFTELGGGNSAFANATDLRLDAEGIAKAVGGKLESNEAILRKRFPYYDNWPADAQLALHSMAWAMGANFAFPKFQAAVSGLIPDFATAAKESYMPDQANPGLRPRNAANKALFLAADNTLRNNLDVTAINWDGFNDLLTEGTAALVAAGKSGVKVATKVVKKNRNWIITSFALGTVAATYAAYKVASK